VIQLLPERTIQLTMDVFRRARVLIANGLTAADAVHLSAAEFACADVLLTCDDRFLRRAIAISEQLHTRVANPIDWLKEQIHATKS
jgi:hypothetical protein